VRCKFYVTIYLFNIFLSQIERMTEVGQKPVVLSREIEGFALNRIQYVILNECYRLLADNILSVKDIDSVMKDGLGMRYAFLGPMETTHLNAEGKYASCESYINIIFFNLFFF
jgi:L-gulonate 3-dehydrogenase